MSCPFATTQYDLWTSSLGTTYHRKTFQMQTLKAHPSPTAALCTPALRPLKALNLRRSSQPAWVFPCS